MSENARPAKSALLRKSCGSLSESKVGIGWHAFRKGALRLPEPFPRNQLQEFAMCHRSKVVLAIAGVLLLLAVMRHETINANDEQKREPEASRPEQNEEEDGENPLMKAKLIGSQAILEQLLRGEMSVVSESAARMQVMSLMENWFIGTENNEATSRYRQHLNRFDFATKELIRHADDGNVEEAFESYAEMTRTCVHCHKLIRDVPRP
jgi:hypothetical protein